MPEDPGLRRYRRIVVSFVLAAALVAAGLGAALLWRGQAFAAFLCVCAMGFFVLLIHGYRQDEEERNKPS